MAFLFCLQRMSLYLSKSVICVLLCLSIEHGKSVILIGHSQIHDTRVLVQENTLIESVNMEQVLGIFQRDFVRHERETMLVSCTEHHYVELFFRAVHEMKVSILEFHELWDF